MELTGCVKTAMQKDTEASINSKETILYESD